MTAKNKAAGVRSRTASKSTSKLNHTAAVSCVKARGEKSYRAGHIRRVRRTNAQVEQLDQQITDVLVDDHPQSVRHLSYRMRDPRLPEPAWVRRAAPGFLAHRGAAPAVSFRLRSWPMRIMSCTAFKRRRGRQAGKMSSWRGNGSRT